MSKPPTILICDDEAHILHVVGLKLRDAGYEVLTAADGPEGLKLAQQHRPPLVITDYLMPGMDGLTMRDALRASPETAQIAVVLLTARGSSLSQAELKRADLSAVFSKPFSPRELLAHVKRCVPLDATAIEKGDA